MTRLLLALLLSTTALAHAQSLSKALVVPSCQGQTLNYAETSLNQLMMDPQGRLCAAGGNAGSANMTTPLMVYANAGPSATAIQSLPLNGNSWGGITIRQTVMPIDGVVANLAVWVAVAVTTNYYTFSLNVNETSTALQCSIGQGGVNLGTTQQCSDTAHQVAVHPGDYVAIATSFPGGTPSSSGTFAAAATTLTSTNGQESLVGALTNAQISATAIQYSGPGVFQPQASDLLGSAIMPTSGKLDHLYATVNGALVAGSSVQFTVFKNGVPTSITTTCTSAAITCTDLIDAITMAVGDTISVQTCPSGIAGCQAGTAIGARYGSFSLRFQPSTPNQAAVFGVPNPTVQPAPAVALRVGALSNPVNFAGGVDTNYSNIAPPTPMTLGDLIVGQCPGPDVTGAGGVTRTLTLRANSAYQSPTVALVGNSTAPCPTLEVGQDTTHTYQSPASALLSMGMTMNTITNASTLGAFKYSMTATVP